MRNTVAELLWDKSRASDNEASKTVFDKWCLGAWTAPNLEPKWVPSKFGTLQASDPAICEKVDNLPGICNIYMLQCWCVPVYASGQDVKVLEHLCH